MSACKSGQRKLRVLHVYRAYFPDPQGGLQEVIRQICLNTRPYGIESRVLTLSPQTDPPVIRREEADVYRFPLHLEIASSGFSASALSGFRELVRWADLINYHFPWPFADVLHLLARVSKPAVLTYHSDIVRQRGLLQLYRPLMHYFLGRMDRIVATSPNYLASSAVLQKYADKVEVIPLALDEASYPQPDGRAVNAWRARTGEGFFLFIGVLRYYKGLHILLEALQGTNLRAVIVGAGPEEQRLKRQAEEIGLDNVLFLGRLDDADKVALIQLCRAIVFPSLLRSEAFGVTLLEGAMFGKPLISCEIGTGTTYVNRDGETGIVVPPGNPARLREAMMRLDSDPTLAQRLGHGAWDRFEELFTGRVMGEEYARLYRALCQKLS
ncbi:MAG: glycosyltransferase family 4 protein [Pseudomonadota bacterium]|nr:glycosyltransferase family 4 protein [Pseudomonadota bacterium]